jgi:hypothetical protein
LRAFPSGKLNGSRVALALKSSEGVGYSGAKRWRITPMSDDQFSQLWTAAIEEHLSGMPEADFLALVAKARPSIDLPPEKLLQLDTTQRHRAVQESMRRKAAQLHELPPDNGNT